MDDEEDPMSHDTPAELDLQVERLLDGIPPRDEASRALLRELAGFTQLPRGAPFPVEAFTPSPTLPPPPLPAAVEAALLAIPEPPRAADAARPGPLTLLADGWRRLWTPWLWGGLAATAALLLTLRPPTSVVKGPGEDAAPLGPSVALHLLHRDGPGAGAVKRLELTPLPSGRYGVRVTPDEPYLPVFQSPDLALTSPMWIYGVLASGGDVRPLPTPTAAEALAAVPGTTHLYAPERPLMLPTPPLPAEARLTLILSPTPLSDDTWRATLDRAGEAPPGPLFTGPGVEASILMELR